jgi:hypothetical protein
MPATGAQKVDTAALEGKSASYLATVEGLHGAFGRPVSPQINVRKLTSAEEDDLLRKGGSLHRYFNEPAADGEKPAKWKPEEWKSSNNAPKGVRFVYLDDELVMLGKFSKLTKFGQVAKHAKFGKIAKLAEFAKLDREGAIEHLTTKELEEELEDKLSEELTNELYELRGNARIGGRHRSPLRSDQEASGAA